MRFSSHISGLSIYAIYQTLPESAEVDKLLKERHGIKLGTLRSGNWWFSVEKWLEMADLVLKFSKKGKAVYYDAGKNCGKLDLLGPIEHLPWFLSTPVLALRNIKILLASLDKIILPSLEYIGREECQIILRSKDEISIPGEYIDFICGYLHGILEMWQGCSDQTIERTSEARDRKWKLTIHWHMGICKEQRAFEELFVEPEFFGELFEAFRKINPQDSSRRFQLLKAHGELRNLRSDSLDKDQQLIDGNQELRRKISSLTTTLFDGIITINQEGKIFDADLDALKLLGFSSNKEFQERFPTVKELFGKNVHGNQVGEDFFSMKWGKECLHFVEDEEGWPNEKLFVVSEFVQKRSSSDSVIIVREKIFQSKYHLELGRTRQFLDSIVSNNPIGLQILDPDGWTVQVNPQLESMLGLNADSILGADNYRLMDDAVIEKLGISEELKRVYAGEQIEVSSVDLFSEDRKASPLLHNLNQPLVVNLKMYPLTDRAGNVFSVVISFIDITESHLLQQHLSELDKLQSIATLASGIAHDFNNILGAIVPNADFIEQLAEGHPQIQKKANTIKQAAKRAASLTQQLLSYSRESKVQRKELSMHSCMAEAVDLISNAIPRSISIFYEPCESDLMVEADPLQMQQVLINLLINASDASPKGGNITVKVSQTYLDHKVTFGGNIIEPADFIRLSVIDQGTGMEEELIDKVFNPFFTTKDKGRGTGLGLSVVHGIIKGHRGFVDISSRVGVGTRFDVHFPLKR